MADLSKREKIIQELKTRLAILNVPVVEGEIRHGSRYPVITFDVLIETANLAVEGATLEERELPVFITYHDRVRSQEFYAETGRRILDQLERAIFQDINFNGLTRYYFEEWNDIVPESSTGVFYVRLQVNFIYYSEFRGLS